MDMVTPLIFLSLLSTLASSEEEVMLHKKGSVLTWPGGVVPWRLADGEFSVLQAARVERALRRLELGTCLTFPRRNREATYLSIRNVRHRCAASVGHKPGQPAEVWVGWPGCQNIGNIQHEVLHALGMLHEHTRPDRDQHITVKWENIIKGKEKNFIITPHDKTTTLPYDYGSVLHYRPQAFSRNGKTTLLPIKASALSLMGQRKGVSKGDLAKLNLLYNCSSPSQKQVTLTQENGNSNFLSMFWDYQLFRSNKENLYQEGG